MRSVGQYHDDDFKKLDYDEYYSNHKFVPVNEDHALQIHKFIPRFNWGLDMVEEHQPKTLLDLGCLDGSFALTVANKFDTEVTGVDLTKDGIALANERAIEHGLSAVFVADKIEHYLEKLAEVGKKFDMVTSFEVIEHVDDPKLMLELIDKVLAPGGNVLISTPSYESPFFGKDDEQNVCHVRLYTTAEEDYESKNKYGNVRKATSIIKEIGKQRIKELDVFSELIHCRYQ